MAKAKTTAMTANQDKENTPAESGGGTAVPALKSVIFIKPHGRYSKDDQAGFSPEVAEELVRRKIAQWPGAAPADLDNNGQNSNNQKPDGDGDDQKPDGDGNDQKKDGE